MSILELLVKDTNHGPTFVVYEQDPYTDAAPI